VDASSNRAPHGAQRPPGLNGVLWAPSLSKVSACHARLPAMSDSGCRNPLCDLHQNQSSPCGALLISHTLWIADTELRSVNDVKFDAESDESESERASRMKVKAWLQAAGLPETPVTSSTLDKGVKGGRVTTVSGQTSNSDLHANKTPASSIFDKPRAGRHRPRMTSPYENEGGNMPAALASSAYARATVPELTRATSSRKNATSFNDDRNFSQSHGSLSSRASSTTTTAEVSKTPRARKTAAAKGAESKTSSGSRFYSYVIKKATRAAQRAAFNQSL
jgi:hypothetical protein